MENFSSILRREEWTKSVARDGVAQELFPFFGFSDSKSREVVALASSTEGLLRLSVSGKNMMPALAWA